MITAQDIIDILPDDLLAALTSNQMGDTTIDTTVIDKNITYATDYFDSVLPNAIEKVKDELILNYVINKLYLYAGLTEQAIQYYQIYKNIMDTYTKQGNKGSSSFVIQSAKRIFTDEELDKW